MPMLYIPSTDCICFVYSRYCLYWCSAFLYGMLLGNVSVCMTVCMWFSGVTSPCTGGRYIGETCSLCGGTAQDSDCSKCSRYCSLYGKTLTSYKVGTQQDDKTFWIKFLHYIMSGLVNVIS